MHTRILQTLLIASLLVSLAAAASAQPAATETATEEAVVPAYHVETVMVEMRDGVHLATDLYLPPGDGPWPVILMRTPYDKAQAAEYGAQATGNGFVLASQDMRGRYLSEGENLPFIACGWGELQDGYDTIAWLNDQDFCDGKIGTVGGSALGITQNLMAPTQPPGLVCQHIGVATSSLYHQAAYQGGALRQAQVEGWLEGTGFDPASLTLYRDHPLYDDFWRQFNIAERIGDIVTPALFVGGWFDTFGQGTLDSYTLRQHQGGEGARGRQWLIMGPWTHSGRGGVECGEVRFPDNAAELPIDTMDLWFGYWLKDLPLGIENMPRVAYYVMGDLDDPDAPGNEWRFDDDWPVMATDTALYLTPAGGLSLDYAPAGSTAEFTADPAQPVSTIGGRNLVLDPGIYDQRPLEER
ncbi:MAG: CocE/NonD family hydrolase, partial [Myxococcales bacterium]